MLMLGTPSLPLCAQKHILSPTISLLPCQPLQLSVLKPGGGSNSSSRQVPLLCLPAQSPQVFLGSSGADAGMGNPTAGATVPGWAQLPMYPTQIGAGAPLDLPWTLVQPEALAGVSRGGRKWEARGCSTKHVEGKRVEDSYLLQGHRPQAAASMAWPKSRGHHSTAPPLDLTLVIGVLAHGGFPAISTAFPGHHFINLFLKEVQRLEEGFYSVKGKLLGIKATTREFLHFHHTCSTSLIKKEFVTFKKCHSVFCTKMLH